MKQTLKEFKLFNETFNLYRQADQIKVATLIGTMCERLITSDTSKPPLQLDLTSVDNRDYSIYKSGSTVYYISKSIVPLSWLEDLTNLQIYLQAIIKSAMVDISLNKSTKYTQRIYTFDKLVHRQCRNIPDTVLDNLSSFRCGFEAKKLANETVKTVRHFGTETGALLYNNSRRAENRSQNNLFIRVMMYGSEFYERPLIDPFTRSTIENYQLYNEEKKEYITVSTYSLHHALFVDGTSVNKYGVEPSSYLNKKSFRDFSLEETIELMGCVALGEDGHKIIHATHRKDDVNGWINRYKRGECYWIPLHWLNEIEYKKTINWICSNNENLEIDQFPIYSDFVKANTL